MERDDTNLTDIRLRRLATTAANWRGDLLLKAALTTSVPAAKSAHWVAKPMPLTQTGRRIERWHGPCCLCAEAAETRLGTVFTVSWDELALEAERCQRVRVACPAFWATISGVMSSW